MYAMSLPTAAVLSSGDAKNMGRRKIEIAPIQNERYRQVTFAKRKLGVIRKATELSVLCDTDVAVIIFGQNKKMSVYSSSPMNELVNRYLDNQETADVRSAFPTSHGMPALRPGPKPTCQRHTSDSEKW